MKARDYCNSKMLCGVWMSALFNPHIYQNSEMYRFTILQCCWNLIATRTLGFWTFLGSLQIMWGVPLCILWGSVFSFHNDQQMKSKQGRTNNEKSTEMWEGDPKHAFQTKGPFQTPGSSSTTPMVAATVHNHTHGWVMQWQTKYLLPFYW